MVQNYNYLYGNQVLTNDDIIVLIFFGVWFITIALAVVGMVIHHFLVAIPLYIMADKAGYAHPFLAFVPFANYYLMHVIPIKEYSYLGMYKAYERYKGFWFYMIIKFAVPIALWFIAMFISWIPLLGYFVSLVFSLLLAVVRIAVAIAKAIMFIDLYDTYIRTDKWLTYLLAILGLFIPLVQPVTLFVLCGKEPVFGYGNFYNPIVPEEEEE